MNFEILILLLTFQFKHLIADYYLQFPYMYENKGKPFNWVKPLVDHSLTHAIGTFIIITLFILYKNTAITSNLATIIFTIMMLTFFDFSTHFITDRIKATRKATPDTSQFWYNLGIDQMIHHTVGILIIFYITTI